MYKRIYSHSVFEQKVKSFLDSGILEKLRKSKLRAEKYKSEWQAVDLNEIVHRFAPDPIIDIRGSKIIYKSQDGTRAVAADLGGIYCRIQDLTKIEKQKKTEYLDIDGNNARNYTDANGKKHGRSRSEYNRVTHFRIMNRREMKTYLPVK